MYGNHEITSTGLVETNGFDEVHSSLYVEGDPPLLLTHVPLRVVPKDCVNIHGHLHHTHVPGSTKHINVCVEQLQYRPGRPLDSFETILKYLRTTRTSTGLRVRAHLVRTTYKTGVKVTDAQMRELRITPNSAMPKWNYTIEAM